MQFDNTNKAEEIPVFAAATGATAYKFGEETFVDIMFFRPVFKLNDKIADADSQNSQMETRETSLVMKTVNSVTLTEYQTTMLIASLQQQLESIRNK